MIAGKLDRRIRLEQRTETQNSFGEAVIAYTLFAEVWAEVLPLSGREFFVAAQFVPEAQLKIRIRWVDGLDERFRVVHEDVNYDILRIAELGRKEGIELIVKKP